MALMPTEINDLVANTLRELGKPKITDLSSDLNEYTALPMLMKGNRVTFITSGYGFQWNVMVEASESAVNVGIGELDDVDILDTTVQATAEWRFCTANYAFDERVTDMNREPARIVDMIKLGRYACLVGVANLLESNFWGPPVSLADETTPWGINTWIVKNATEGFNGGAPSGHTTIGLNPTTYPRWQNWTAQYTALTKDDFVRKARRASRKSNFKPPVNRGISTHATSDKYGYYTTEAVYAGLEEMLEAQNDNLGNSINPKDGLPMFARSDVQWVPKLDADTTDPFYGICWGDFHTYVLKGWWLNETHVPHYPNQHNVNAHFMDSVYQHVMTDRRRSFVIATGTSYPS